MTDLDAAIRALEMSTNPTLTGRDAAVRRCNCVAARHPLQAAAPNCLECGKVVCVREGLGPCTWCGKALLSTQEVQEVVQELREELGREKMAADRAANRRADVAGPGLGSGYARIAAGRGGDAQAQAVAHRDKLLGFQAHGAQRTTIRDEAADFDVAAAAAGRVSAWATPRERARELRAQQRLLRESGRAARPEYERPRQAVLRVVGGKVIRQFTPAPPSPSPPSSEDEGEDEAEDKSGQNSAVDFNPLRGPTIRPVYQAEDGAEGRPGTGGPGWRRVQDDEGEV